MPDLAHIEDASSAAELAATLSRLAALLMQQAAEDAARGAANRGTGDRGTGDRGIGDRERGIGDWNRGTTDWHRGTTDGNRGTTAWHRGFGASAPAPAPPSRPLPGGPAGRLGMPALPLQPRVATTPAEAARDRQELARRYLERTADHFRQRARAYSSGDPKAIGAAKAETEAQLAGILASWGNVLAAARMVLDALGTDRSGLERNLRNAYSDAVTALFKRFGAAGARASERELLEKHRAMVPTWAVPEGKFGPGLKTQQAQADKLVTELMPHFLAEFSRPGRRDRNPYGRVGAAVPVRVLATSLFARESARDDAVQRAQDVKAMLKFRRDYVSRTLSEYHRSLGQPLPQRLRNINENTPLTDEEIIALGIIRKGPAPRAGAFYGQDRNTVFISENNVKPEFLAHELCHAYASKEWNELLMRMSAYPQLYSHAIVLDEAVTSALADVVLASKYTGSVGGGDRPSGYGGYGPDYQTQGNRFLELVERRGSAGTITMEAYFEGEIRSQVDDKVPLNTSVAFGVARRTVKLSALLTPIRGL